MKAEGKRVDRSLYIETQAQKNVFFDRFILQCYTNDFVA